MAKASDMLSPPHASAEMGTGSAALTKQMKIAHDKQNMERQMDGQPNVAWPAWLAEQGYALDGNGLVYKAK